MFERLVHIDKQIFLEITMCLHNAQLDVIMPFLRDKMTWIPLYAIILFLIVRKYKLKAIWVLIFVGLTVLLADRISAGIIKPLVVRLRPCNDPCLADMFTPLVDCGSGFSFVSSHATNHFALALFFISIFLKRSNRYVITSAFLIWASVIAFAQVYVGVHYPADVLGGALLGAGIGYGTGWVNDYVLCTRMDKVI